jgi:hypothetical protein
MKMFGGSREKENEDASAKGQAAPTRHVQTLFARHISSNYATPGWQQITTIQRRIHLTKNPRVSLPVNGLPNSAEVILLA